MPRSLDSLKAFLAGSGRPGPRLVPGVTVFGAGKGGVGTSTLSALVGMHAARRGASVLLVDADETAGSQHLLFDLPASVEGLGSLRGGRVVPEELLVEIEDGLDLLPGGGGGIDTTLALAAAERRLLLRRVAALYGRYDLVLVDGGSRLDSVMAACAAGAGRLYTVTTPHRIAEAAAFALVKVARGRFPALPVEVVVNRAAETEAREVHQVVDAAAATFLEEGVAFAAGVPDDPTLERRVAKGESLATAPESLSAFAAAGALADRLLAGLHPRVESTPPTLPEHSAPRLLGR